MYITYDEYASFYGYDRVRPDSFERLELEASRIMDMYTSGIDGFRKLKEAFPTDEGDAKMVKFCCARLVDILSQIAAVSDAAGMVTGANGTHSGMISSYSAGNESISYGGADASSITKAAADITAKEKLINELVQGGLRGLCDANGVNLMYMGRYPRG